MDELIVGAQELEERLVQDINESKMPAFIVDDIINRISVQVTRAKEQQYNDAKANLEKKSKKKEEK